MYVSATFVTFAISLWVTFVKHLTGLPAVKVPAASSICLRTSETLVLLIWNVHSRSSSSSNWISIYYLCSKTLTNFCIRNLHTLLLCMRVCQCAGVCACVCVRAWDLALKITIAYLKALPKFSTHTWQHSLHCIETRRRSVWVSAGFFACRSASLSVPLPLSLSETGFVSLRVTAKLPWNLLTCYVKFVICPGVVIPKAVAAHAHTHRQTKRETETKREECQKIVLKCVSISLRPRLGKVKMFGILMKGVCCCCSVAAAWETLRANSPHRFATAFAEEPRISLVLSTYLYAFPSLSLSSTSLRSLPLSLLLLLCIFFH